MALEARGRDSAVGVGLAVVLGLLSACALAFATRSQVQRAPTKLLQGGRTVVFSGMMLANAGDEEQESAWPFAKEFQPSKAAVFREDGRVVHGAKCQINGWTGGPQYLDLLGGEDYRVPQNSMCSHSPPGIPDADRNVQAKKYGFSCYSDGKCAIYPKEEQAGVDGIARDDMWVDAPAGSPRA